MQLVVNLLANLCVMLCVGVNIVTAAPGKPGIIVTVIPFLNEKTILSCSISISGKIKGLSTLSFFVSSILNTFLCLKYNLFLPTFLVMQPGGITANITYRLINKKFKRIRYRTFTIVTADVI